MVVFLRNISIDCPQQEENKDSIFKILKKTPNWKQNIFNIKAIMSQQKRNRKRDNEKDGVVPQSPEQSFWVVELLVGEKLFDCSTSLYGPFDTLEMAQEEIVREGITYPGIIKTPRMNFPDE